MLARCRKHNVFVKLPTAQARTAKSTVVLMYLNLTSRVLALPFRDGCLQASLC
jgi:hypothetical protein